MLGEGQRRQVELFMYPFSSSSVLQADVPRLMPTTSLLPDGQKPVVRHPCGERTIDVAREAYAGSGVDVELETFIEDMAAAYAWADLVVCRAGALTIAELCAVGLPALLVPYPSAVDDHQTANASPMAEAGAAEIISEATLTEASLAERLGEWLADRRALESRAHRARALATPDSLERISSTCLELAGRRAAA